MKLLNKKKRKSKSIQILTPIEENMAAYQKFTFIVSVSPKLGHLLVTYNEIIPVLHVLNVIGPPASVSSSQDIPLQCQRDGQAAIRAIFLSAKKKVDKLPFAIRSKNTKFTYPYLHLGSTSFNLQNVHDFFPID